jgi:hypothetical protein
VEWWSNGVTYLNLIRHYSNALFRSHASTQPAMRVFSISHRVFDAIQLHAKMIP